MRPEHEGEYIEYVAAKLGWLRRLAYLLCHDWHSADDITQVTITRLYVHWRRASSADNLDAYVRTMLIRTYLADKCLAWHRVRLTEDIPERQLANVYTSEATSEADTAAAIDVRTAITHLPPRQRATLVLRYFCDLSVDETAAAMGCSAGTVKSQSAKAFTAMRAQLGEVTHLARAAQMKEPDHE